MSMHSPYNRFVDHGFYLSAPHLPIEYRNYLTTCHYFDSQCEQYIKKLKDTDIYENSIIVITDHNAHLSALNMEGRISDEIPLFIVNGGIDNTNAYLSRCNQLDVYTTLLDIMGVGEGYLGLGHSLCNSNYSNSITDETDKISNLIIRSNYFSNYYSK